MVITTSCQLGCCLSFASPITQSCNSAHLEVLEWCNCALFTPDIQGCTGLYLGVKSILNVKTPESRRSVYLKEEKKL